MNFRNAKFFIKFYSKAIMGLLIHAFRPKVIILGAPVHTNLGDQAQFFCTLRLFQRILPEHKVITLPTLAVFPGFQPAAVMVFRSFVDAIFYGLIRSVTTSRDLLVGHSGYYFVDHHPGWPTFARALIENPNIPFLVLPQTVNFYAPVFRDYAAKVFSKRSNLLFLCRDKVSFELAKSSFEGSRILLYPDIVTSLIGEYHFNEKRDGVLFCLRDDIEGFYSRKKLHELRDRFSHCRTKVLDTTLQITREDMAINRQQLIVDMIHEFSTYAVIVTDRYHGTIFAQIAGIPTVVLDSNDHKLRSGVDWFNHDWSKGLVWFAADLEQANDYVISLLDERIESPPRRPVFVEHYWNRLRSELNFILKQ